MRTKNARKSSKKKNIIVPTNSLITAKGKLINKRSINNSSFTLKKAYYYLFYKLYKFVQTCKIKSKIDIYVGIVIGTLEFYLLNSFFFYYKFFFNKDAIYEITSPYVIISILFVILLNTFAFIITDKWKNYMTEFDQWPSKKNMLGGLIVWGILSFVMVNLIFSIYLIS